MPAVATPTRIKKLSNNPGKRKIKPEPEPTGLPVLPRVISPMAKQVWDRLSKSMPAGVYTTADSGTMAAYCEAVAMHDQLTAHIIENDLMISGSTGQEVINPAIKERSNQARLIMQLGVRLGLDPIARQQINDFDAPKDEDEGFGKFL